MLELRQRRLPFQGMTVPASSSGCAPGERSALYWRYREKLTPNADLNRALVSFQGNKSVPFYRWLKYKEAFSSKFVKYILDQFKRKSASQRTVLDPFAGAGTAVICAAEAGWRATGIELLPVGIAAMNTRLGSSRVNILRFKQSLAKMKNISVREWGEPRFVFPHLKITQKAFPPAAEKEMAVYSDFVDGIKDEEVQSLFRFALLAILEEISFTRKDGQYLRWDFRSGKGVNSHFNKGAIAEFWPAIIRKLETILEDLERRDGVRLSSNVTVIRGSCLAELPRLPEASFDLVITSPPYCNRYDYTRTYALELAYLGYGENRVKELRQTLLSSTVENRSKRDQLTGIYESAGRACAYRKMVRHFETHKALQEVLGLLRFAKDAGQLNNNNIPAMVEGYFFEMNLVVQELARVLRPGGHVVMVNDNVQYIGEEIPVDLILSDFATQAGLNVDSIWVLPRGKGNSSQQMGTHGRNEIRKCVYVWSK